MSNRRHLLIFDEKPTHFPFPNLTGPISPNWAQIPEHNPAFIHGGIMTLPGRRACRRPATFAWARAAKGKGCFSFAGAPGVAA